MTANTNFMSTFTTILESYGVMESHITTVARKYDDKRLTLTGILQHRDRIWHYVRFYVYLKLPQQEPRVSLFGLEIALG